MCAEKSFIVFNVELSDTYRANMCTLSSGGGRIVLILRDESPVYLLETETESIGWSDLKIDPVETIALSPDGEFLAFTCKSKLTVFNVNTREEYVSWQFHRPIRRLNFHTDSRRILIIDRGGTVSMVTVSKSPEKPQCLISPPGLLLDALLTPSDEYVIVCDRDEKIRVCHYPQTYNIASFCLGHTEYVGSLKLLPHDQSCLVSCSGDGTVRFWDYAIGKELCRINVYEQSDEQAIADFQTSMKQKGLEVDSLPVRNIWCYKVDENTSMMIVHLYSIKCLFLYEISSELSNKKVLKFKFLNKLELREIPADITIDDNKLFVCFQTAELVVQEFHIERENIMFITDYRLDKYKKRDSNGLDELLFLYKRKFDNVLEYQQRKKQRLEKK